MMTFAPMPINAFLLATLLFPLANPAKAKAWDVDTTKSKLLFSATQAGARFEGRFTKYNVAIAFDQDHLDTSHIVVTVNLASAVTGDVQRDTALPEKEWFDIAQFPQAKYEATSIIQIAPGAYEAHGNLTLRGVSQPLNLPFKLETSDNTAHAQGHIELTRTNYGVGQGAWNSGQWVSLEVGVDFDIVAKQSD